MSFESLTDAKIDALLRMEKRVTNPTKRTVQDGNHFKCDYQVASADEAERFVLFVRQNKTVTDDFSCGLQWLPPGSPSLILVRYNGPSHAHPNRLEGDRIEFVPHIHRTTERYLRANLKAEGFAAETKLFTTWQGALHALVTDCKITGLETNPEHPELFP